MNKEEVDRLLKFYAVDTLETLVEAQAAHIERLQAKLPQSGNWLPPRVREG